MLTHFIIFFQMYIIISYFSFSIMTAHTRPDNMTRLRLKSNHNNRITNRITNRTTDSLDGGVLLTLRTYEIPPHDHEHGRAWEL